MSLARDTLRWNGWGRLAEPVAYPAPRERWLREALGQRLGRALPTPEPPVDLAQLRLPPAKLSSDTLAKLEAACAPDGVRTSPFERVTHSLGKSLPDLLRLRRGEIESAPDAVVYPADEGAVAALLRIAADADLAVVPFGGGTSVVGGVDARSGPGQAGVISLDTTRLDALLRVDADDRTATFQAGIDGPALEDSLRAHGLTLGHFPQSFEQSTLGGWIATLSCGQLSSRYGVPLASTRAFRNHRWQSWRPPKLQDH